MHFLSHSYHIAIAKTFGGKRFVEFFEKIYNFCGIHENFNYNSMKMEHYSFHSVKYLVATVAKRFAL